MKRGGAGGRWGLRSQFAQQETEVMARAGGSFNPLLCPLLHLGGEEMCPEKAVMTLLSQRGGEASRLVDGVPSQGPCCSGGLSSHPSSSTQQPPGSFQNTSPIMSVTLESLPCSPLNRSSLEPCLALWLTRQALRGPSDLSPLRPPPRRSPPPPTPIESVSAQYVLCPLLVHVPSP